MNLLRLLSALLVISRNSAGFRRTNIRLNPTTGGYEDISIVVGAELPPSSCPQIIENIKVRYFFLFFIIDGIYSKERNYCGQPEQLLSFSRLNMLQLPMVICPTICGLLICPAMYKLTVVDGLPD